MNGGEFDETLSRFLSDLESLPQEDPLPESSLLDLECLLRFSISSANSVGLRDDDSAFPLWPHLAAAGISHSCLLRPLSAAMELHSTRNPLLASRVYLDLILTPCAPVLSLFTPIAFISLLRSLRQALKPLPSTASPNRRKKRKQGRGNRNDQLAGSSPDDGDILISVLLLLDSALSRIRLDSSPDNAKSLVETIVAILSSSTANHHNLAGVCFRILFTTVSHPVHGDQTDITVEILRSLARAVLSSSPKSALRTAVISFVTGKIVPLSRQNGEVRKALVYFPRYLAFNTPERAEPRAATVDAILEVVRDFEKDDQIEFAGYMEKMAQGKWQLRFLACDLILGLLTSLPDPLGIFESLKNSNDWGIQCLMTLMLRCSDSMGGVRARALTNMAQAIEFLSKDARNSARLKEVVAFGSMKFSELLRKRCSDEKAAVRKAALLLITRSTSLIGRPIDELVLKTIGSSCLDSLVSIRKAAVSALSEVYRQFPDEKVIAEWLHTVLPLIADNETTIQEECENLFLELVLNRISTVAHAKFDEKVSNLESLVPNGVLALLKGMCDGEVLPCVKKICTSLGKKNKLKPSIAISLEKIISSSESLCLKNCIPIERWTAPNGAWQLLAEVSLYTPKAVRWEFVHHHWKLLDKAKVVKGGSFDGEEPNSVSWARDRVSLLQTISNVSLLLPPVDASDLAAELLKQIDEFNMHLSEVDAHVKALRTLCKQKAVAEKEGDQLIGKWVHQLVSGAQKILEKFMSKLTETAKSDSFFTPPNSKRKEKDGVISSNLMSQAITATFTIGSLVLIYPSADMHDIVPLLHTIITSGKPVTETIKVVGLTISVKEMAPSLYVQSWVTMGKICLTDDKLAKLYIPLFAQELEKSDCTPLRNNILVVMVDFCVRYTALVDCYIPKITSTLRDPCEVVRRQTFILLSRLLQRDYVKWRGVLFLRFLLSLVDDSEKIRSLADYLFGSILKVKAPLLAYNSFIEAIFFLNGCNTHSGLTEATVKGSTLFSLSGKDEEVRSKRMHIYTSLLKQMAPEHLLATSAKLCAEILAAASDGLISIDDATGQSVVQDTLNILACKEMRIQTSKSTDSAEMEDECGDPGGAALLTAKSKAVTQVAKKNLIQHAVPIFIELKRLLETKNSPLMGSLMECLRVLLKDYKNEIDEILVADKQLQKELIYDIEKYEAGKAKNTVAEAITQAQQDQSVISPKDSLASTSGVFAKVSQKLGTGGKIGSAVAEAAAKFNAMSVLREASRSLIKRRTVPPSNIIPSVRAVLHGTTPFQQDAVLESLRRGNLFESDGED